MQVVILCNNRSKEELLDQKIDAAGFTWIDDRKDFPSHANAAVCMDLLFENKEEERHLLQQLLPRLVIVNSVVETLEALDPSFVRINGWPGFLKGEVVEASCADLSKREKTAAIFSGIGKSVEWLPDIPGFISPRVVSMIINEAFFALEDGVSTPQEIDTAMKLGTNYPYGPFEWADLIGLHRVAELLQTLAKQQKRYAPCPLLLRQVSLPGKARPSV